MEKDTTSTATRIKATKQLRTGTKKQKSPIIDQLCTPTGAGHSSARHYLASATLGVKNTLRLDQRKHKPTTYSTASKKLLIQVWRMMGMPSGKNT